VEFFSEHFVHVGRLDFSNPVVVPDEEGGSLFLTYFRLLFLDNL